jgi:hypothetical protein
MWLDEKHIHWCCVVGGAAVAACTVQRKFCLVILDDVVVRGAM